MGSGSDLIAELLRELNQHSVWADVSAGSHDFDHAEIRYQHAKLITMLGDAIRGGDSDLAGNSMIDFNRNRIIGALAIIYNEQASPSRLL
jgi:hypothetical protein